LEGIVVGNILGKDTINLVNTVVGDINYEPAD